jgi:hypothetical protein
VALFPYGSRVYETANEQSDYDFIAVVKDTNKFFNNTPHDISVYSIDEFKEKIKEHEISVLECLFIPNENILKKTMNFEFNLDLQQLRTAISSKSSNSWVKAKKKFIVEKDFNPYVGKKSAWHAIRILDFGEQIAKSKCILDFTKMNDLLPEIMACESWEELDGKFRATYNAKSTNFKSAAPKLVQKP